MIVAVVAAPILAVQVQKVIASFQRHQKRRQDIFEVLMSTRAQGMRTSHEHVRALNMIDIDFSEKRFFWGLKVLPEQKPVIHAWELYKDHLDKPPVQPPNDAWGKRAGELFVDVLYAMSESLGYNFDKVMLEKDVYRPQAHLNLDIAQQLGSNGCLKSWKGGDPSQSTLSRSHVRRQHRTHRGRSVHHKLVQLRIEIVHPIVCRAA